MHRVDMTVMRSVEAGTVGDCLRACIASLLELKASDVPHFTQQQIESAKLDVWAIVDDWLAQRGLALVIVKISGAPEPQIPRGVHYIGIGPSPRGMVQHAVIYSDGAMVHDPHPSRAGIETLDRIGLLVRR